MKPKRSLLNLMTLTIISGIIFVISSASTALAVYYSGGYSLYSMTYSVESSGSSSIFSTAANNWTTAVGTTIRMDSTSPNKVYFQDYPYNWFGQYTPYTTPVRSFRIDINNRRLQEEHPDNLQNAWISTATHEFGHAQYLDDRSGYASFSIMSHGRDRGVMTKPQTLDINDINSMRQ